MYKLTTGNVVLRMIDMASIPMDPENMDYQAYLVWVGEGNEPIPVDNP